MGPQIVQMSLKIFPRYRVALCKSTRPTDHIDILKTLVIQPTNSIRQNVPVSCYQLQGVLDCDFVIVEVIGMASHSICCPPPLIVARMDRSICAQWIVTRNKRRTTVDFEPSIWPFFLAGLHLSTKNQKLAGDLYTVSRRKGPLLTTNRDL